MKNHVKTGRPGVVQQIAEQVAQQRGQGMKWGQIAKYHGCSVPTAVKALKFARARGYSSAGPEYAGDQRQTRVLPELSQVLDVSESAVSKPEGMIKILVSGRCVAQLGEIPAEEMEKIVNAARVLRKYGVEARILALTEVQ